MAGWGHQPSGRGRGRGTGGQVREGIRISKEKERQSLASTRDLNGNKLLFENLVSYRLPV